MLTHLLRKADATLQKSRLRRRRAHGVATRGDFAPPPSRCPNRQPRRSPLSAVTLEATRVARRRLVATHGRGAAATFQHAPRYPAPSARGCHGGTALRSKHRRCSRDGDAGGRRRLLAYDPAGSAAAHAAAWRSRMLRSSSLRIRRRWRPRSLPRSPTGAAHRRSIAGDRHRRARRAGPCSYCCEPTRPTLPPRAISRGRRRPCGARVVTSRGLPVTRPDHPDARARESRPRPAARRTPRDGVKRRTVLAGGGAPAARRERRIAGLGKRRNEADGPAARQAKGAFNPSP